MKQLTKKEFIDLYEDYCKSKRLYKPAMMYNFLVAHGTKMYSESEKNDIWDKAQETEELLVANKIQDYKRKGLPTNDIIVKEGNIRYEAKRLAVLYYFEWLDRNNKQLFTDKS